MRAEAEENFGLKKIVYLVVLERFDFEERLEISEIFVSPFLTEIESSSCSDCKGNISP